MLCSLRSWNKISPVFGMRWWAWWRWGNLLQRPAVAQWTPASLTPTPPSMFLLDLRAARWKANSTDSRSLHPSSSREVLQLHPGPPKHPMDYLTDSCPRPLTRAVVKRQAWREISPKTLLTLACSPNATGVEMKVHQARGRFLDRCTLCQRKQQSLVAPVQRTKSLGQRTRMWWDSCRHKQRKKLWKMQPWRGIARSQTLTAALLMVGKRKQRKRTKRVYPVVTDGHLPGSEEASDETLHEFNGWMEDRDWQSMWASTEGVGFAESYLSSSETDYQIWCLKTQGGLWFRYFKCRYILAVEMQHR